MDIVVLMIAGTVVPPVASFLKSEKWPNWAKLAISLLVSLGISIGAMAINGSFQSWQEFVAQFAVVWATSQLVYKQYFSNTDLNSTLTGLKLVNTNKVSNLEITGDPPVELVNDSSGGQ